MAALGRLRELGVLCALHPRLHLDEGLTRASLALLPEEGRADLLLLAALLLAMTDGSGEDPEPAIVGLLDHLQFTAGDRDRALATVLEDRRCPRGWTRRSRRRSCAGRCAPLRSRRSRSRARWPSSSTSRAQPPAPDGGCRSCATCACRSPATDLLAAGIPAGPGDRPAARARAAPQAGRRAGRRSRGRAERRHGGAVTGGAGDRELARSERSSASCPAAGARCSRPAPAATCRPCGARTTSTAVGRRERLCEELGLQWLCASRQVHGTAVQRVRAPAGTGGQARRDRRRRSRHRRCAGSA